MGTTPNLGLQLPVVGGSDGIWGTILNNDLTAIDGLGLVSVSRPTGSGLTTPGIQVETAEICLTGGITRTLPDATAHDSRVFTYVNAAASGTVTVATTAGQTISGQSTVTLAVGQYLRVLASGGNYFITASSVGAGTETLTGVTAGTGLSGGGTSGTVTLNLANTAVAPASYTNTNLTVNAQGQITAASNGTGGAGGVALTMPGEFVVTPGTTSASQTVTKANESPNTVWAGPQSQAQGNIVQMASSFTTASQSSFTCAFTNNNSAGNTLVAIFTGPNDTGNAHAAITDTRGNTWTFIAGNGCSAGIFRTTAAITSGANTVTVTINNGPEVNAGIILLELSGMATPDSYDGVTGAANNGANGTPASIATAAAVATTSEMVICGLRSNNTGQVYSAGAGATKLTTAGTESTQNAGIALVQNATTGLSGIQTISWSVVYGAGVGTSAVIAAFKLSSVGGQPTFRALTNSDLPPGRLNRVLMISTSGTYTPTAGTRGLFVEMVGGGGGGGGCPATSSNASAAGGGASGAYSSVWIASPAASYSVTIGAAGAGGAAGSNAGGAGGQTSLGSVTAPGGGGGAAGAAGATAVTVVAGGTSAAAGAGADLAVSGGTGGRGLVFSATLVCAGVGAGTIWSPQATPNWWGGAAQAGGGASGPGGGGGGAMSVNGAAAAGGAGGAGMVRVWEYV